MELVGTVHTVVDDVRRWLAAPAEPAPVVVETSGSSGVPKRVLLSRRAVLASAQASARRLEADGAGPAPGPWVLLLPPTFVAGLQVVVRSLVAGHDPLLALPEDQDVTGWSVSLVPTQLHRMLDDPAQTRTLARAHTVLLGGGPAEPALRARAAAAGVRVVATYGSAETAGGCVYDGAPLDGVRLEIDGDGRIRIGGPTLFDGYEGDPELSGQVLDEGWFTTADAGEIDDGGRLRVLGRVDDVVVSGGLNVPGPAVADRLRTHPDVAAAEVIGVPDAEWGHRLVAFVTPRPGAAAPTEADLRAWVTAEHPRAWAPRQVVLLDDVPLLTNGKPDRLALRRLAQDVA